MADPLNNLNNLICKDCDGWRILALMNCPTCGTLSSGGNFCANCGGQIVPQSSSVLKITRPKSALTVERSFLIGAFCVIGLIVVVGLLIRASDEAARKAARKSQAVATEQAEHAEQAQRLAAQKFADSPAGKKAREEAKKASSESARGNSKAQAKAALGFMMREAVAKRIETFFLDRGVDVECLNNEAKLILIIKGPSVNRPFAHNFLRESAKPLRDAGFKIVSFWNGKSGFSSDEYSQDFDLTR